MTPNNLRRWIYIAMAVMAVVLFIVPPTIFIATGPINRDNLSIVGVLVFGVLLFIGAMVGLRTPRLKSPDPASGQAGHRVDQAGITGPDGTVRWIPETLHDHTVSLRNPTGEVRFLVNYLDDGGSGKGIAIFGPDRRPLGSIHNRTDLSQGLLYGIRDGQGRPRAYLEGSVQNHGRQFAVKVYAEETTLGTVNPVVPFFGQPAGMVTLNIGTPEPFLALCALFALEYGHFQLRLL